MGNGHFLIERYVEANEYRLFVTSDGFFAAVQRTPASVLGDGISTIQELVNKENFKRMNPRDTCLCEIKIDEIVKSFLHIKGFSLNSVPLVGERVFLRQNSNVSTGGNCIEITNSVHNSVIKLANSIREKLGVSYLGIDLLCDDIGSQLKEYVICELNSAPGLSLHMMPENGKPQNTASAVADVLFPETKQ
jgi:cyanophycin synthetase